MKKLRVLNVIAIMAMIFVGFSCSDDDDGVKIIDVKVTLSYADGIDVKEGIVVKAKPSGSGTEYEMETDDTGSVLFELPAGSYEFTASETRTNEGKLTAYNALASKLIADNYDETSVLKLEMEGSTKSQLVIKELYMGGCPTDDGEDYYRYGQYITIYNNSTEPADLQNLCIGTQSSNSNSMKYDVLEGETEPYYFKEDWTPAGYGYFYFPNSTVLEPGKEITVAISGGIDHTQTHSQSVDLSGAENYVCYDIEVYDHALTYPAPSANIPASKYLKAVKFGLGTAVVMSYPSPAIFLFYPPGQTPMELGNDESNYDYYRQNTNFPRVKVPAEWTVDGIDVLRAGYEDSNVKRINPKVDAGYVYQVSKKAYTLYRNVDKDATEVIEGNSDKLVYNYTMGTENLEEKHGTTDPSGIDAEASLANGAVIIFKDTNNSSNDFHMRQKSSLRD